ncbi:MAG: HAD-IC family P-type ATPase, partial [Lachnospiraceae bacterium]|nr:HAD-IC family P-type ATPase [Lachnospiraceae bacterium]
DGSVSEVSPMGLIVILDCIRKEAPEIFSYFREQNVEIKVISGDNPVTVSKIAGKAGLLGAENYIDASTIEDDPQSYLEAVQKYNVFGRVKPEQKQKLVHAYQAEKKVVGMVGDGVNDVLALKDADCGIAMAAGSDAAKQSAHIVLLDSNFACLQNIVSEGRTIIANIERVSALYLTKTIYSILLCVVFILLGRAYPFIPVQLSLISAACIGLPSFVLTLEHTEEVTSTGFLRHVMQTALPAALTMVGTLLVVQVLLPFWNQKEVLTYTFDLLIGGMVGILVVFRVCRPLNWLRGILCGCVIAVFLAGVLLLPDFLGTTSIFCWQMVLMIPFGCMIILLYQELIRLILFFYQLRDRIKERMEDLFPRKRKKGHERNF